MSDDKRDAAKGADSVIADDATDVDTAEMQMYETTKKEGFIPFLRLAAKPFFKLAKIFKPHPRAAVDMEYIELLDLIGLLMCPDEQVDEILRPKVIHFLSGLDAKWADAADEETLEVKAIGIDNRNEELKRYLSPTTYGITMSFVFKADGGEFNVFVVKDWHETPIVCSAAGAKYDRNRPGEPFTMKRGQTKMCEQLMSMGELALKQRKRATCC